MVENYIFYYYKKMVRPISYRKRKKNFGVYEIYRRNAYRK